MTRLTAANLIREIAALDRNVHYNYVSPDNSGRIQIVRVDQPEGPIVIKRYNPSKGGSASNAAEKSLSSQMIWRVANATREGIPLNFDRVLGGSYSTRSVLEALLAHTPQFHFCYPGRIEEIGQQSAVKVGHKHLMWMPSSPHQLGVMARVETEVIISEVPSSEVIYEGVILPDIVAQGTNIDVVRRHVQMQIALISIGHQLRFQTWVAQGDRGIRAVSGEFDSRWGIPPNRLM